MFLRFIFLVFSFPLFSEIPTTIWQTYKTTNLPESAQEARNSWLSLNPEYMCYLYGDLDIEKYIRQNWPADYLGLFHSLPIGAMKADLWRYLVIASDGGVYCDIDSVCLQPVRDWPLAKEGAVLLIDLDIDQSQFCQWTFAATPRHPAMHYICYYVLNQWKQRKGLAYSEDGKIDVLATTGPIIFSQAIKSYIGEPLDMPASAIVKKYTQDKTYRERLNRLGVFFANKGFFSGQAVKNLFWGSWSHRTAG
jgi:mannosyltransferase OCH1-like enzyme